jgi:general secretion pathway protein K
MTTADKHDRRDAGYVLVSMLWIVGLLATAVASMSVFASNSMTVLASSMDRARAHGLLEAGLEVAVSRILATPSSEATRGRLETRLAEGRLRLAWKGETGKIDLNLGPRALLAGILARSGVGEAEADSVLQALIARRTGAGGQPPLPFRHVGELAAVGLSGPVIARLRPFVTVYGGRAQIDPRLAPRDVLAVLPGVTEARLRRLLGLRDAGSSDWKAWTEEAGEDVQYLALSRSPSVLVQISSVLPSGLTANARAVVMSFPDDSEPYRILSWEEVPDDGVAGPNGDVEL